MSGQETRTTVTLEDRYLKESGTVYLNGLQALVRLPIEQNRRDRADGLRIGTFISGYPGSPLGTYDMAIQQVGPLARAYGIVHVPGQNEELAATAVYGTQMLDHYPHARYDGVVGIWYGKGPGIDRAGDALKHGNFAGTSKHGAVVVLMGEDHECKSSTMPFQDDYAMQSAGIPVLYPSSVGEFLDLGLHTIAMSRYSGCWTGFKLVGALCDGGETVYVSPDTPGIVLPELQIDGKPFRKHTDFKFFPGSNIETERRIYYERHTAVRAYARANGLDRVHVRTERDRVGIITAGKSYADTRQALLDLGIRDDDELRRYGIRLLQMALIYPADPETIRTFAEGLDQIVVIEEKRGFLETQVKEALCGLGRPIRVVGKFDEAGVPLFPIHGGMDADMIAERLGPRLLNVMGDAHAGIPERLSQIRSIRSRQYEVLPSRTPNYCSGCPHNTSTRLLDGQVAWGSPGCHSFASIIEQPKWHIEAMTQYGGEGLPWIGLAPFTDRPHMIQNVGDGSLFHSSYQNIRFAVAAGVNITYKILYNGYIANTGAQAPVGAKSVVDLVSLLATEGVRRIVIVSKEPERYAKARLPPAARVFSDVEMDRVLRDLEETSGVTVLLYDGECANERRRQRKRGKVPAPEKFVVINKDVCENCGHCGALTNCMSLHKVETEFGPKTQVHQLSCNQDYACLGGDCPSFVTVYTKPGTGLKKARPPEVRSEELSEPTDKVALTGPFHVYIPGVGGTGIITINALLSYAALMDGHHALSYDQTGAAQKWGPVLSSLVISPLGNPAAANKVGVGKADLYLAFDLMAGASKVNLDRCDPQRTAALINTTLLPSGEMIRDSTFEAPTGPMEEAVHRFTNRARNVCVEARRIAEELFGDYMATNMLALGVAYQSGLLPLSAESIEGAIVLNGVAVTQNLQAFRYGRLWAVDPGRVRTLIEPPRRGFVEQYAEAIQRLSGSSRRVYEELMARCAHLDEESQRLLAVRVAELIDYQDARYASRYLDFVLQVAERDQRVDVGNASIADNTSGANGTARPGEIGVKHGAAHPTPPALTHATIRGLHKLMAYKDEYEVARLHLNSAFQAKARALFDEPRQVVYNLHPPLLRALGMRRKLQLGEWFNPALRALRGMKGVRGTPFDPFGYAHVRREERRLVAWYRDLLMGALDRLSPDTYALAVEIASLPDMIRGYEGIKLDNAELAERRARELVARVRSASTVSTGAAKSVSLPPSAAV